MTCKVGNEIAIFLPDLGAQIAFPPIRVDLFLAPHADRRPASAYGTTQPLKRPAHKNLEPDECRDRVPRQANEGDPAVFTKRHGFSRAHIDTPKIHAAV